jgi:hypothetical protein
LSTICGRLWHLTSGRAAMMAKDKREKVLPVEKDCWHLYSLQDLSPTKFIDVVDKIFKGQYNLITPKYGILKVSKGSLPK